MHIEVGSEGGSGDGGGEGGGEGGGGEGGGLGGGGEGSGEGGGGDEGGEGSGGGGDTRMRIPRLALRAVREDEEEGEGLTGATRPVSGCGRVEAERRRLREGGRPTRGSEGGRLRGDCGRLRGDCGRSSITYARKRASVF